MRNLLLASLFVLCLTWRNASGIMCYYCESSIYENNTEIPSTAAASCAYLTGITPVNFSASAPDYYVACYTRYVYTSDTTTITRGPTSTSSQNYCTSTGTTSECTCNSDSCNSEPINVSPSYDCYECQSSEYFDNGCGDLFNSASAYVSTINGCSACYKNVAENEDHSLIYTRGCTRAYEVDQSCVAMSGGKKAASCACKGSLCNSAQTISIKSVTVFSAFFILSLVVKLTC